MSDLTLANSQYQTGTQDTAATLTDNVDTVKAQHVNGPNSAIVQIETILGSGTGLKGNLADLNTRLNVQMDTNGNLCPVGSLLMYTGSAAPTGWLFCDGSQANRTTYANLFAVIGTAYGAGDGSTTFNLPDFRGRSPVGVGTGAGGGASGVSSTPSGGNALTAVARGTWRGEETHTLTTGELPAHNHGVTDPGHVHQETTNTEPSGATQNAAGAAGADVASSNVLNQGGAARNTVSNTTGITTQNTGSGTAHNVEHPVMGVNFIIRT